MRSRLFQRQAGVDDERVVILIETFDLVGGHLLSFLGTSAERPGTLIVCSERVLGLSRFEQFQQASNLGCRHLITTSLAPVRRSNSYTTSVTGTTPSPMRISTFAESPVISRSRWICSSRYSIF